MIFHDTKLQGAFLIDVEKLVDERGFFARSFCHEEFRTHGLNPRLVQCSLSFNRRRGTLRGMHYQSAPYGEDKLVRCTRGAMYDVIVDLRRDSVTFKQWLAVELAADTCRMLYIPQGVAHGFQTLQDDTEAFYQMSEFYHVECAKGFRWDDPTFGIEWPLPKPILSMNDRAFPNFQP